MGDLKLVERPQNYTLAAGQAKVVRANIKVGRVGWAGWGGPEVLAAGCGGGPGLCAPMSRWAPGLRAPWVHAGVGSPGCRMGWGARGGQGRARRRQGGWQACVHRGCMLGWAALAGCRLRWGPKAGQGRARRRQGAWWGGGPVRAPWAQAAAWQAWGVRASVEVVGGRVRCWRSSCSPVPAAPHNSLAHIQTSALVHTRTHTHTHVHTHTHTHKHSHTCTHTHMHTQTHIRTCTHVRTHTRTRKHTHTHTHTDTHTRARVCRYPPPRRASSSATSCTRARGTRSAAWSSSMISTSTSWTTSHPRCARTCSSGGRNVCGGGRGRGAQAAPHSSLVVWLLSRAAGDGGAVTCGHGNCHGAA